LETAATGVLQVVQIFAYLILFEPKIMLIDEPDAHLHPDKQERLIETLERAAKEFETQIILTTHSPHITRAASPSAKLVWMHHGEVATDDDDAIRRLLGWGGLDKAAFFFVEDEDDKPIRAILRQWPELGRRIAVCRCFGIDNLPQDKLLSGLLIDGEIKVKAIVHRDRDFMTDLEALKWRNFYKTTGVFPWVTSSADVEGYFCEVPYLMALFQISEDEANLWRNEAAKTVGKAHDTFLEKRKSIVRAVWPNGGSPDAEQMWRDAGGKTPVTVKGKKLLAALKVMAKNNGKDDKLLDAFTIPSSFEIAIDLKKVIEVAVEGNPV
jgi:energy-coupling factor transporter ATP-binding protein EcfA2